MSYLQPHELGAFADPFDVSRAYPQLLRRARDTADRAELLGRQNAQLRNELERLRGLTQPIHRCGRCGGNDRCPTAADEQPDLISMAP